MYHNKIHPNFGIHNPEVGTDARLVKKNIALHLPHRILPVHPHFPQPWSNDIRLKHRQEQPDVRKSGMWINVLHFDKTPIVYFRPEN